MKNFNLKFSIVPLAFLLMQALSGCMVHVYDEDPVVNPPCNYGPNGADGFSFLALDYSSVAPDYIWGDNMAIPSAFYFGEFYNSAPGTFNLYYEGGYMQGCCFVEYYWDVEYNIWFHPGTSGGPCGQAGLNGADSFLTIWMDPEGPDFARINKKEDVDMKVELDTPEKKIVEFTREGVSMKVVYTKLKESRKGKLEGGREITAFPTKK